jgi:glutamyl-tRNA reductase
MDDLSLLHRKGDQPLTGLPERTLVWKTCLRQIAFVTEVSADFALDEGDEMYTGSEAFAFLLEIVCGLHSPVVGETEVFGQFKTFSATALEDEIFMTPGLRSFFQSVILAAKTLRAEHLVGLGSQGYGSLVRKLSKTEPAVTLMGSGQLVEEILPWLAKQKKLQVVCRTPAKAARFLEKYPELQIAGSDQNSALYSCVVIAAPLTDQELLSWLESHPGRIKKVLDLRGELQNPELFKNYQFIGLKDFFASIEQNKQDLSHKVVTLKEVVQRKAQEYYERSLYRPYGWEDLCV